MQYHKMADSMIIFEDDCDLLLQSIMPTVESFNRRKEVNLFVNDIIRKKLHGDLFGVGSYCLMTYLPESDIDLVLITDHGSPQLLNAVFDAFYDEIASKDENTSIHHTMTIRNIGLVNGRTKVANLMVNNIGVDVTVNQTGEEVCLYNLSSNAVYLYAVLYLYSDSSSVYLYDYINLSDVLFLMQNRISCYSHILRGGR
jgi:DNA polymerase sigma